MHDAGRKDAFTQPLHVEVAGHVAIVGQQTCGTPLHCAADPPMLRSIASAKSGSMATVSLGALDTLADRASLLSSSSSLARTPSMRTQ